MKREDRHALVIPMALVVSLGGCGGAAPMGGADLSALDLGATTDASAQRVTYVGEVRPLLQARCSRCHSMDGATPVGDTFFPDRYADLLRPSQRCAGDVVGTCVGLAVANQAVEGDGCRTYVVRPFHRESWPCLSAAEQALIAAWIQGGMPER